MPRTPAQYRREYVARVERAVERGFTGYPEERKAKVEIAQEAQVNIEKGWLDWGDAPRPGSEAQDLLLRAIAEVGGKPFVRGEPQVSEKILARLRELYPDRRDYFPIVKMIY